MFYFLSTFFDSREDVVLQPVRLKRMDEGSKKYARKKISNFYQIFDNFRKTSSPRYERENQALFTTAFMQRGGDPLWS